MLELVFGVPNGSSSPLTWVMTLPSLPWPLWASASYQLNITQAEALSSIVYLVFISFSGSEIQTSFYFCIKKLWVPQLITATTASSRNKGISSPLWKEEESSRGLENDNLVYGQDGVTESLRSKWRQYTAIPFTGGLAAWFSAMRTQIGGGGVIKQSPEAVHGTIIDWFQKRVLKTIIFVVSLIFTLNPPPPHAIPQHLPMSLMTTPWRKKDSVEKEEVGQALEAS